MHVPNDLDSETNEQGLMSEIKQWLAFARQKPDEVIVAGWVGRRPNFLWGK